MTQRAVPAMATLAALSLFLGVLSGCSAKKKEPAVGFLTAEEQYRLARRQLAAGKMNQARTSLQRVQYTADDRRELEPLVRIALADATFYQGHELALIDARTLYLDFVTLFSDHPMAPYAQFQAGICSLKQVAAPSKDQTLTLQAIAELREAERRFPSSPYATAAGLMLRLAESNLAEHEFIVGRFYLKKKAYLAAADRFRKALESYPQNDSIEKLYLYLGQALLESDNPDEARVYLDKLVSDFPHGKYVEDAKKALAEAGGALATELRDSP